MKTVYKAMPLFKTHNIQGWSRRHQAFIEEDTRYKKHCTQDNDASVSFRVGSLGPHTILPITISCPVVFSWIPRMVWNLSPFKGDFSSGKSQKSQGNKPGLQGGYDLMFCQKTLHETWCMSRHVAVMKLPTTSYPYLWPSESPNYFPQKNVQA